MGRICAIGCWRRVTQGSPCALWRTGFLSARPMWRKPTGAGAAPGNGAHDAAAGVHRRKSWRISQPLTERAAAQPDATLTELRGWLLAECGISVGLVTVWRALKRLGVTLKK